VFRVFKTALFVAVAWMTSSAVGATIEYHGTRYLTFVAQPDQVEIYWRDADGQRIGQFSRLQEYLAGQGRVVRFMMNAGIFEQDGTPSGLLISDGVTRLPLNQQAGAGNFYLQPNGVFFTLGGKAFVRTTAEFAKVKETPRVAIQSGPLLLRDGRTHPAFRQDSMNRLHRNGVGILRDGRVLFAITELDQPKRPNLWEFADFFRSQGCADALFLDGVISQMVVDPKEPVVSGNDFGAIFAVSEIPPRH
jgi:uncharacterized protein YigE (DUF2233 family)